MQPEKLPETLATVKEFTVFCGIAMAILTYSMRGHIRVRKALMKKETSLEAPRNPETLLTVFCEAQGGRLFLSRFLVQRSFTHIASTPLTRSQVNILTLKTSSCFIASCETGTGSSP